MNELNSWIKWKSQCRPANVWCVTSFGRVAKFSISAMFGCMQCTCTYCKCVLIVWRPLACHVISIRIQVDMVTSTRFALLIWLVVATRCQEIWMRVCARVKWMAREISYRHLHNSTTFICVKFLCLTIKTEHSYHSNRPDLLPFSTFTGQNCILFFLNNAKMIYDSTWDYSQSHWSWTNWN